MSTTRTTTLQPGEFIADFINPSVDPSEPAAGKPVVVTSDPPVAGTATVRTGTANALTIASGGAAHVVGVISQVLSPTQVVVKTSGFVTLTTTQWDAVTLESGGLVPGRVYFLSFGFNDFGHLSPNHGTEPDGVAVQVGIALNPTTLVLSTPSTVA